MRSVEARLAKLEDVLTPDRPVITYTQDRHGGTGLFRRATDGAMLTRDQVAQDAQECTAIIVIYQPNQGFEAFNVAATQVLIPDNGRNDSD